MSVGQVNKELIQHIQSDDIDKIKEFVNNGVKINGKCDSLGNTAIHLACRMGSPETTEYLLSSSCGVDINECNTLGDTGLHEACARGHMPVVELLVQSGAKTDCKNHKGWTPLHSACSSDKPTEDIITFLSYYECNINETNAIGDTGLHLACHYGNLEAVKELLNRGACTDIQNNSDRIPAEVASNRGYKNIVSYLKMANGEDGVECIELDLTAGTHSSDLKLSGADTKEDNSSHKQLLGEPLNEELIQVLESGKLDKIIHLVKKGVKINGKCDTLGNTAIHISCCTGSTEMTEYLLSNSCDMDVNECNTLGNTGLHVACSKGQLPFVKVLVQYGAKTDCKNNKGWTPLHSACSSGKPTAEVITFLSYNGCNINETNATGDTGLHLACHYGNMEAVKELINLDARTDILNNSNHTPDEVACNRGFTKIENYLTSVGNDPGVDYIELDMTSGTNNSDVQRSGTDHTALVVRPKPPSMRYRPRMETLDEQVKRQNKEFEEFTKRNTASLQNHIDEQNKALEEQMKRQKEAFEKQQEMFMSNTENPYAKYFEWKPSTSGDGREENPFTMPTHAAHSPLDDLTYFHREAYKSKDENPYANYFQ